MGAATATDGPTGRWTRSTAGPPSTIEDADGRLHWHDIEVETEHYRGQHAAAKAGSGFNCYQSVSARIVASGSRGGGGRRGRGCGLAEEMFL
ncbi:MAG: hypothetical protein U0Q12_14520 [Vicinamibacterales bacterium]